MYFPSHTHARLRGTLPPIPSHICKAGNDTKIRSKADAQKTAVRTRRSSPQQQVLESCLQHSDLDSVIILAVCPDPLYRQPAFLSDAPVSELELDLQVSALRASPERQYRPLVQHLGTLGRKRYFPEPVPHPFFVPSHPRHVIIHISWLSIRTVGTPSRFRGTDYQRQG